MKLREVTTGGGKITYELTKKPIKKMYLRVKPDGRVTVSVPNSVTVKEADAFVKNNEAFILKALEKYQKRVENDPTAGDLETGGRFYLLGKPLTLELQDGFLSPIKREEDTLVLQIPFPFDGASPDKEKIAEAMNLFYQKEIGILFFPLMEEYQSLLATLNIPQAFLKVRSMKSQWGSCNRRNNVITLNSKLIQVPLPLIEYVVLHEFCHFIHGNHSKDFYDLVAVYMADWKERRQELKKWSSLV